MSWSEEPAGIYPSEAIFSTHEIRRRGYGRQCVHSTARFVPNTLSTFRALIPRALGRIGGIAGAIGRQIQLNQPATLYRTYEDPQASLSNSYAPTRTLGPAHDGRFGMFQGATLGQ